jgi:acyl-CoA thioesterase-1
MKIMKQCRALFGQIAQVGFVLIAWISLVPRVYAESPLLEKVRAGGDVKIALLGTSLTSNGTWPTLLQNSLTAEAPGPGAVAIVNLASSGKSSNHGLSVQTPAALLEEPDAVFIEFGINDAASSLNVTLQESEDNLNAMIDQFVTQNPDVILVLQTMNVVAADSSPFSPRPDLANYYQVVRDVAAERGAILVDHYPNWLELFTNDPNTWESYMTDAVHPNALGQSTVLLPELRAVFGISAVPGPTVSGSILFQDDFSGVAEDGLDGTLPDATLNNTTWVADTEYQADGSALSGQPTRRAYLTLGDLIDGNRGNYDAIYTLTATIDVVSGDTGIWEGFGFWSEDEPARNFASTPSIGTAWMIRRDNDQMRVFRGPRIQNGMSESPASPNNVAGTVDCRIVLDLTDWNGTDNWGSVNYSTKLTSEMEFTELATGELDATNSSFRAVGLGGGAVTAKVSSFQLSKLVEFSPRLSGLIYLHATGESEINFSGNPNTRYKLVRADDLDFSNPTEDPLALMSATIGTIEAGGFVTDSNGNATLQFNLGTGPMSFVRAEEFPVEGGL